MLPVLTRPLPKRNENVTAACFRGTLLVSDAGGPSPLAARPSSGRVDVVASFDLLTATAVLDDESSFILILIVTVTGAVDSVDGEVVYGVPSHTTCHSTSAHLTIVAVVATQRRTAGHGPARRPLSSLLAERPYSLVEPAPLDDGKPAGRLNLR